MLPGVRCPEGRQRCDDWSARCSGLSGERGRKTNLPGGSPGNARTRLIALPHAVASITRPIVGDVSPHRAYPCIVVEFCGFDNCRRIVRLKGSGEVIGGVGVSAEELQLPRLLADRDLDSLIDEPVPLVVRHMVGIVECRIDESTPDSSTGAGCVDLVSINLRRSISVLPMNVARVDYNFAGQLGTIANEPLSNISLMTVGIEGLAQKTGR